MAIATLTIDIVAKLASLQTGFDRAAQLSERNAKRIEEAFKTAGTAIKGAFAGIGVQQLIQAFNQTAEGLAKFKDVAEQTGIAVEELSKLEPVARQAGLTIDDVGNLSLKLSKALSGVDDESKGAGKAIAQLGIDLNSFRQLGAADQVQTLAKALDNFKDDANKAAVGQAILRGEWSKAAGFLKDLAQAGQLNASVTADQAAAADAYNKQLERLQMNIEGVGRSIVGYIAPRVNNLIEQLRRIDWSKVAGSAFGSNGAMLGELGRQAAETGRQLRQEELQNALQSLSDKFNEATGQGKKSVGAFIAVADASKKAAGGVRELNVDLDGYSRLLRSEKQSLAEWIGVRDLREAEESFRRVQQEIERINELTGRGAANKMIADLALIDDAFFAGKISVEEYENALLRISGITDEVAKATEKTRSVAEDLGLTFSSAFEDAIVGGKDLRDVVRGLEQDILRIVTRKLVTEPLANLFSGFASNAGGLLSSLFARASGGPVTGGYPYLVGEKGPELFVPSSSGSIVPNSRMGGANITINIAGSATRDTANQIAAAVRRQLMIVDARAVA